MKNFILSSLISRLMLMCACLFSVCSSAPQLTAACVCSPSTGCIPQPCTGCSCCNVFPNASCTIASGNTYLLRYFVTGANGAMTFIGNTLGLSKIACNASLPDGTSGNNPGTTAGNRTDAIGAFTTTNSADVVNNYVSATSGLGSPGGTTLDWTKNSSTAILNIPFPPGSEILRAELIWSGSFGYYCENDNIGVDPACILNAADTVPVKFTTPDNVTHLILADPTTAMQSKNPGTPVCGGNYVRSADVTGIVGALVNPNGTYTVGGVPATISGFNNTQNAAGWTLAVVYLDPTNPVINNMTLFISNQQASNGMTPAVISGFCAAPVGTAGVQARLLLSAIETDANKGGDSMLFGPTSPPINGLTGPNNLQNNFFAAQINDDNGNLVTTGTYGTLNGVVFGPTGSNADPLTQTLCNQGRQGYDITNVDVSPYIAAGQTTAFARATTSGDDYMINALGLQLSVNAPVIVPVKKVNGQNSIQSQVGDTVTFSFVIDNSGAGEATNVFFQDTLQTGLVLVPNSFILNNGLVPPFVIPLTQAQLAAGVLLGSIPAHPLPGHHVEIQFQAQIVAPPISGNIFLNQARTPFQFNACDQTTPFDSFNLSNIVTITLPAPVPTPTNVNGVLKKCKFLNKDLYSLRITWDPPSAPGVIAYQILKNGFVIATVPANGPLVFETCLDSKSEASAFTIVAVFAGTLQDPVFVDDVNSPPLQVRITNE